MKQRDLWKQRAKDMALISPVACPAHISAWNEYRKFRNQVNNKNKYEEQNFKSAKMTEVADSPDLVWKSAKSFMGWKSQGTPNQLKIGNQLVTSAKMIAQAMNEFFLNKVQTICTGMISVIFNQGYIFFSFVSFLFFPFPQGHFIPKTRDKKVPRV
jgi:hypothetical protein